MHAGNKPANHRISAQKEIEIRTICSFKDKETQAHKVDVTLVTPSIK